MAPSNTTPSIALILERIEGLRQDVSELKTQQTCNSDALYRLEKTYVEKHVEVVMESQRAHDRLNKLEPRVDELSELIKPLVYQSRIITAIGSAALLSVLALVWAILTHQVTVGIP